MTEPADVLAHVIAELGTVETDRPTPTRDDLADCYNDQTWRLPRGATFTTHANYTLSVETHWCRDWERGGDVPNDVTVTVYGTMTRGERTARAHLTYRYNLRADAPDRVCHAYTSADGMPPGAKQSATDALRPWLDAIQEHQWRELAREAIAAKADADLRRDVSEAVRAIERAVENLARRAVPVELPR